MKKNLLCISLLFILTLLYFAPVIFSPSTFLSRDLFIFYNPKHFFAAETIRSGMLPLWNPYLACGVPFQANVQSALFYPLSSMYYLLPFQTGYKYFIILHYFLGSLFMFLLMREWCVSHGAALFSGIVFAFGGYLASILDNVCFLAAAIWLPLILLLHHRALASRAFFYTLLAGFCIGLQILAGDASFYVLSTILTLFLYTLFWSCAQQEPRPPRVQPWIMLVLSVCLGLLLAAVQLIPLYELVGQSIRYAGLSFATVTKWSYHPLELLQLIVPYLFGTTVPETRWFGQYWLDTFYLGVFPLAFMLLFIGYGKSPLKAFQVTLLIISVCLSFGEYTPLYGFLYRFVPGTSMLQYPVKLLFPASFSLAYLAGVGLAYFLDSVDAEHNHPLTRFTTFMVVIFILLGGMYVAGAVFKEQAYAWFDAVYPQTDYFLKLEKMAFTSVVRGISVALLLFSLLFLILAGALSRRLRKSLVMCLIIGITFVDLTLIGKPQDPYADESIFTQNNSVVDFLRKDTSRFRIYSLVYNAAQRSFRHLPGVPFAKIYGAFQKSLHPNLNIYCHLSSIDEYADIINKTYYRVFDPVTHFFKKPEPAAREKDYCGKILDLLNVKYIVSLYPIKGPRLVLVLDGSIKIYKNPTVLPRAFLAKKLIVVESEEEALRMMEQPSFNPKELVYISKPEVQKLRGEFIPKGDGHQQQPSGESVIVAAYQPNYVVITATADEPRFLVLADNYYPGWKAFVDGQEKPVLKVDYTLRGILLDKGAHEVTFVFRPWLFRWGAWVSSATLVAVLVSLVMLWRSSSIHERLFESATFYK